jgi:hypothetical protein
MSRTPTSRIPSMIRSLVLVGPDMLACWLVRGPNLPIARSEARTHLPQDGAKDCGHISYLPFP